MTVDDACIKLNPINMISSKFPIYFKENSYDVIVYGQSWISEVGKSICLKLMNNRRLKLKEYKLLRRDIKDTCRLYVSLSKDAVCDACELNTPGGFKGTKVSFLLTLIDWMAYDSLRCL